MRGAIISKTSGWADTVWNLLQPQIKSHEWKEYSIFHQPSISQRCEKWKQVNRQFERDKNTIEWVAWYVGGPSYHNSLIDLQLRVIARCQIMNSNHTFNSPQVVVPLTPLYFIANFQKDEKKVKEVASHRIISFFFFISLLSGDSKSFHF